MSSIQPYGPAAVGRTARGLARIADQTDLAIASIDATVETECAKLEGIGRLSITALHCTAIVSSIEASLAQSVPHASGRLATVADLVSAVMAEGVITGSHRVARS